MGWFVESATDSATTTRPSNEDAFDLRLVSVTTGTDYNFGPSVVGFSVGYDHYNADFDQALLVTGGDVEVNGISGSLFGGYLRRRLDV